MANRFRHVSTLRCGYSWDHLPLKTAGLVFLAQVKVTAGRIIPALAAISEVAVGQK